MENGQDKNLPRAMIFDFEEGCRFSVSKNPGALGCDVMMQATTAAAALKGISLLAVKLAETVDCTVEEVLCKLAVVLLTEEETLETEGDGDGCGEG